jgi:negative regulator of flagellin synthesis FlgM
MKIGNPADKPKLSPVVTPAADGKTSAPSTTAVPGGTPADPSAQVKLSNTAETLRSGADTAEFDAAKVERISQAIADGSYKVNPEAIADKLIANAQELLGKVQR